MRSRIQRAVARFAMLGLLLVALPATAQMRITEYMYGGSDGEFVEFTNVGVDAPST